MSKNRARNATLRRLARQQRRVGTPVEVGLPPGFPDRWLVIEHLEGVPVQTHPGPNSWVMESRKTVPEHKGRKVGGWVWIPVSDLVPSYDRRRQLWTWVAPGPQPAPPLEIAPPPGWHGRNVVARRRSLHDALGLEADGRAIERQRLLPEIIMVVQRFGSNPEAMRRERKYLDHLIEHDDADDAETLELPMKRRFAVVISVVIALGFVGGSLVAIGVAGPQDLEVPLVTGSLAVLSGSYGGLVEVCHQTGNGEHAIQVHPAAVAAHLRHGDYLGLCSDDGGGDNGGGDDGDNSGGNDGNGTGDPGDGDDGNGTGDPGDGNGTGDPGDGNGTGDPGEGNGTGDPGDGNGTGDPGDGNGTGGPGDGNGTGDPGGNETDSDGDGLNDTYEEEIGTDPFDPDTDGDGVSDGDEVDAGTDPLQPPRRGGGGGGAPLQALPVPLAVDVPDPDQPRTSANPTPPAPQQRRVTIPGDIGEPITLLPPGAAGPAAEMFDRLFGRDENPVLQAFNAGEGKMPVKQSKKMSMLLGE